MWNDSPSASLLSLLLKGCLGGVALVCALGVISVAVYFVLSSLGLRGNFVLTASIASGPIVGTVLLALYALTRSFSQPPLDSTIKRHQAKYDDEDA